MYKLFMILMALSFFSKETNAQTCDTSFYEEAIAAGWSAISYNTPLVFGGSQGFTNGADWLGNLQKANAFNLSSTPYTYIHGAIIKFGAANSNVPANLSKVIKVNVYSEASNKPAGLLGSTQLLLSDIKKDVDLGNNTNINFPSPIALPASKKFFVSVDISTLVWQYGIINPTRDSLWIAGTADDELAGNTAWDFTSDSTWEQYTKNYTNPNDLNNDLNISLWIFPYVSTSSAGCGLLPVNLLSFTATRNSNDVTLKWEVSNEINMKGYSIEKADNNGNYKSIAFTSANNNLKNQTYTVTDRNAFAASSTVQYRLKQINADGSAVYSRIISVNHNTALTDVVYQNPFTGALKLQVTLAASQKISVLLYDMQGRLVTAPQPQTYTAGVSSIILSNTTNIKPGTYLLKLSAGNEQMIYKVVKQ